MAEVLLSLGSNLGDRARNIKAALNMLDIAIGVPFAALSSVVETEAVGFDGPPFLNAVVRYRTAKSPQTLLKICKTIERNMGRTDAPEYDCNGRRIYHDRIIDIDILTYGDRRIKTPELTIPHPQVRERKFIKPLMKEVKPNI